jgi:hypothetical protein
MKLLRMKKYFAWGAGILVAAAVASLVAALPAQEAYCTICGAQQETRPYGLRFTSSHTLFTQRAVSATPFSALLEEKHLVSAHQHRWLAPRVVPDPRDEFGPPVLESLGFLNAPRVVNFMRNVADYADPVTVANWRDTIMRPSYTRVTDDALRFSRVPKTGFPDRTEFLNWWGQNAYALSHRVRQLTEPD